MFTLCVPRLARILAFACLFLMLAPLLEGGGKDKNDPKKDKKDAKKKDAKKEPAKKDDDGKHLLKQMLARFDAWDVNNDQVLDKFELAKAFRGPKAKPFDAVFDVKEPKGKEPPKVKEQPPAPTPQQSLKAALAERGKVRSVSLALVSLPRGGLPVNLMAAELLSHSLPLKTKEVPPKSKEVPPKKPAADPSPPRPQVNPAVMQLPDFQFLALLNKNADNRITRHEFETWARGYAKQLDRHQELERDIKEAKNRVSDAKTPQARVAAEKELARSLKEMVEVNAQLNAIPPALHKALKAAK